MGYHQVYSYLFIAPRDMPKSRNAIRPMSAYLTTKCIINETGVISSERTSMAQFRR